VPVHRRRLTVVLALVAAVGGIAAVAASRETAPAPRGESAAKAAAPTWFGDVKSIVDGRCAGCHRIGGIAPFSLTSYESARAHRAEVAYAVSRRLMPPWHAQRGVRRYLHDPSLTISQIGAIVRWAKAGAPRGDAAHAKPALASVAPAMTRVDRRIRLAQPYTPKGWLPGGDDYHCFVVPWTGDRARYVTGFNAIPAVPKEVHHIIVFLAAPTEAATVDGWDAAEAGPGYRCYGGASAVGARTIPVRLLAGWAPGLAGGDFPAGTGIEVPPGSRLILQFHYNLAHAHMRGGPKPDRSALEFEVADSVERRAAMLPIVDLGWILSPATFAIPANGRPVQHSWQGDPAFLARFFGGGIDFDAGVAVEGVILHMHRLGLSGSVNLRHASGATETLLRVPRWDFDWQRAYFLADPPTFRTGDRLGVSCTHRNTTGRTITWGESSSDEMCLGFVYVAERP
jgi:mono/diheme cytochrome c family protein